MSSSGSGSDADSGKSRRIFEERPAARRPHPARETSCEFFQRTASSSTHAKSAWLFGRGVGLVFLIAFVSFHVQLEGLVGDRGILPASELLEAAARHGDGFLERPTLAWFLGASSASLHSFCLLGEVAALLLLLGWIPAFAAFACALLYLSLHSVGGPFLAFQWDTLLIEVGFLTALVAPWRSRHRARAMREPPALLRWGVYLLFFRLIFLAGVVKLSSRDPAWASLRALEYHYFTQPLPNPLSWFAHQLPSALQSVSVACMFVVELALPFGVLLGRHGRRAAFAGVCGLMVLIALSGNYGFFNLLAIVLAVPLLDDAALDRLTPRRLSRLLVASHETPRAGWTRWARVGLLVVPLVVGAEQLLLGLGAGPHLPDAVFTPVHLTRPFRLANGYGLFAVMTRVRHEIRIEGSMDGTEWREYRFLHKPGDPSALPGISAPHMPRLDWQMWFAALGSYRDSPWLGRFLSRLLEAEPAVLDLLEDDPFDGRAPRYVRARLYDYRFGDGTLLAREGVFWEVEELGDYSPVLRRAP